VPRSERKPHFARTQPGDEVGQALVRIADNSTRASKEMVELLRYEGRQRDMKVEFGDKERVLMQHLSAAPSITVDEFCALAGINRATASRTLVHLVKANVLAHTPQLEAPDQFYPKLA
jgi:Fic family protein